MSESEHLERLLEQTTSLRAPIAGEVPSGADLSLEPDFEKVKAELDKLTSLEGGEVAWGLVVEQAESLLSGKTKDLRLAVWLAVGGLHQSGWRGFARGLLVCRSLLTDLWEHVFPKRDKARANIVLWLGERAASPLEELRVRLDDGDDVRLVADLVKDIDALLAEKLGDGFGGIRSLVSLAKRRVGDIPPPPPPPPVASPGDETAASNSEWADDDDDAAAPAPVGTVALSTRAEDADATTRTAGEAMVALARAMIAVDPARPWAYRLHRQGIWLPFERIAVDSGVLAGPGLESDLALGLRALLGASRWPELVVAAEEASARAPLWLDPHRFVAIALERMGTAFHEAREVVGRDTTDFFRRWPFLGAGEVRFADGSPAASPETVEWLETESRRWQTGSRAGDVARDEDHDLARRFADARELVAAGRHAEGLAMAMQLARRGSDTRERFRSSLNVARLAIHAGAYEVARPILEGLVTTAQAHALETWDPTLCARLYEGLFRCLPETAPDRPRIFEVLCRLDPGAALRAQSAGRGTNGDGLTTRARVPGAATIPTASPNTSSNASPSPGPTTTTTTSTPTRTSGESEWADDD